MAKSKRLLTTILMIIVSSVLLSAPVFAKSKAKPKLSRKSATIQIEEDLKLKVKGVSKKQKVTWSSSDEYVADIWDDGSIHAKITGLREGTAIIRAKVGKKILKCKVTVTDYAPTPTPTPTPEKTPYQKLAEYISANGQTTKGNIKRITLAEASSIFGIVHDASTNIFTFTLNTNTTYTAMLDMRVDSGAISLPITFFYANSGGLSPFSFNSNASTTKLDNFTDHDIYFTMTSYVATVPIPDSSIQKLSNINLKLAMAGWRDLLNKVGLTFNELGFVK